MTANEALAPDVAMKPTIDARPILLESDRAAFLVATPDFPQGCKLRTLQRRLRARGAEDHGNLVGAGAIDGVPECGDLLTRHPVLRIQQHHGIDLARRKTFEERPQVGV